MAWRWHEDDTLPPPLPDCQLSFGVGRLTLLIISLHLFMKDANTVYLASNLLRIILILLASRGCLCNMYVGFLMLISIMSKDRENTMPTASDNCQKAQSPSPMAYNHKVRLRDIRYLLLPFFRNTLPLLVLPVVAPAATLSAVHLLRPDQDCRCPGSVPSRRSPRDPDILIHVH